MSKAPKVLGTLSIVFGSLIAAWSPLSLFMRSFLHGMSSMAKAVPVRPGMRDPAIDFGAAEAILDAQSGYMTFSSLVFMAMSIALIVIGVGLIKRRRWARKAAIGWSALGLALIVVQATVYLTWLQPRSEAVRLAYYAAHDTTPPPGATQAAGMVGGFVGWLIYASFPIVMILILGKRSAVDDFTA